MVNMLPSIKYKDSYVTKITFALLNSYFAIRLSNVQSKSLSKITRYRVLCMQLDTLMKLFAANSQNLREEYFRIFLLKTRSQNKKFLQVCAEDYLCIILNVSNRQNLLFEQQKWQQQLLKKIHHENITLFRLQYIEDKLPFAFFSKICLKKLTNFLDFSLQ